MTSFSQLARALKSGTAGFRPPTYTLRKSGDLARRIAVQTHFSYQTDYATYQSQVIAAMVELGIKIFRERYTTNSTVLTITHGLYTDHGMQQLMVIPSGNSAATDFAAIKANYTPAMVYAIEGYNEPDPTSLSDAAAEAAALAAADHFRAFAALLRDDPDWKDVPLVAPSFVQQIGFDAAGDLSAADYLNSHQYPDGQIPENGAVNFFPVGSSKPVMVTETGYHVYPGTGTGLNVNISNTAYGIYLPRLILYYLCNADADVQLVSIYEMLDEPTAGGGTSESYFGLLDGTGQKRPVFYALKNWLTAMRDDGVDSFTLPADQVVYTRTANTGVEIVVSARSNGAYDLQFWKAASAYTLATDTDVTISNLSELVKSALPIAGAQILDTMEGTDTGTAAAWTDLIVSNDSVTVPVNLQDKILRIFPRSVADQMFMVYDDFAGSTATLDGRTPVAGPDWVTNGGAGSGMTAGNGLMKQAAAAGNAGYAYIDHGKVIKKLVGEWQMTTGDFTYPATIAIAVDNTFMPMLHGEGGSTNFYIRIVEDGPTFIDCLASVNAADFSLSLNTIYRDELHYNGKMAAMVKRSMDGAVLGEQFVYDFRLPDHVGNYTFWETLTPDIEYTMASAQDVSDYAWPTITEIIGKAVPTTSDCIATVFGGTVTNSGSGVVIAGTNYGEGGQFSIGAITSGDSIHFAFDASGLTSSSMEVGLLKDGAFETEKSNAVYFTANGRISGTLTATETLTAGSLAVIISPTGTAGQVTVSNLQIISGMPTSL